jgi:hypothetical protein
MLLPSDDVELTCAGVVDADGDAGELGLRHQVNRQALQRNGAEQDHHEADHEHRHGTMNCETRNAHSKAPAISATRKS